MLFLGGVRRLRFFDDLEKKCLRLLGSFLKRRLVDRACRLKNDSIDLKNGLNVLAGIVMLSGKRWEKGKNQNKKVGRKNLNKKTS